MHDRHYPLGSIPIPSTLGPTDEWMMFIDFGPDVDISGVEFASVNALVVTQTVRYVHYQSNTRVYTNLNLSTNYIFQTFDSSSPRMEW